MPRTSEGRPDLQGIWQVLNTAAWNIEDHSADLGIPAGQGVVEGGVLPYHPAALVRRNENFAKRASLDPEAKCYLPGLPRVTYLPFPFQIVQVPGYVIFAYEYRNATRIISTDNGRHPTTPPFWMGDSRGRWEGDTLVIDVASFTDQTWFDRAGNFHSDALHIIERYTRTGPDHLAYEVTVDDPKVFTRPWKMSMPIYRRQEKNVVLLEYQCHSYAFDKDPRYFSKLDER
ncbi:MAG: hypothetical protein HYY76_17705 [Acidobacteria bacterium]|nr:hypothetical protein [Acidobacteriota bacterium]